MIYQISLKCCLGDTTFAAISAMVALRGRPPRARRTGERCNLLPTSLKASCVMRDAHRITFP